MFGLLNIRKLILSFLIIIVTILIYIVIVTFVVKVNVDSSLKSLKPHINFACYNPFNNILYINGFKLKFEDSNSLYSEISFEKVNLIFEKNIFLKNNIFLDNLILENGLIKINHKEQGKEKFSFTDTQSSLKKNKTNKKPNLNRKFVVKNLFIDTDLILKDKSENEYLLYLACTGNNISNFEDGSVQIVGSSYNDYNEFNTQLNINYYPNNLINNDLFSITGSIENIPSSVLNKFLSKVKLQYESLSLDCYICYRNNDFDGSKVILRLNNANIVYKNYSSHMTKFQFPIHLSGSYKSPKTNFSEGLNLLKDNAVQNFIQIIGNKIEEEYGRIEDQAKEELKKLDDNLGISELDEKFQEEYGRIEDQAKEELKKLDDNLGISELDEKIEQNINLLKNKVLKLDK